MASKNYIDIKGISFEPTLNSTVLMNINKKVFGWMNGW